MDFKSFVTDSFGLILASSKGYFELVELLIQNYPDGLDVDKRDESGRSSLLWSILSHNHKVSNLLLDNGADFAAKDDNGNNVFHLAADNDVESIKEVVFHVFKKGILTEEEIIELLHNRNNENQTPFDLCSENMENLLSGVEKFCKFRMKRHFVKEICLRSGNNNGTVLPKKQFLLDIKKDEIVIDISKNTNLRIPNTSLAFIILSQKENRVEFTLRKLPILETNPEEEKVFGCLKCLAFYLEVDGCCMIRMADILRNKEKVMEFKKFSFVYKPQGNTTTKKVSPKKFAFKKREHILEKKIMKFKNRKKGIVESQKNNLVIV